MAKELNEDTGFHVSVKTLVGIGAGMAAVISMWVVLQFDMKDQLIRQTIMSTQEDVTEIKQDMKRIEEKIDKLK